LLNTLDKLLDHRVVILFGKGGVGRSAVSTALAVVAARRGMRTLVMETDTRTPITSARGKKSGFAPVELTRNLFAMMLGGQESLEDYLGLVVPRPILRAVFASSLYQVFVHAAPGIRELTMMGKIYHEIERRPQSQPRWDLIIVDMPASGQALSMFRMPFFARQTFGDGIVAREAEAVATFLRDERSCAAVIVTTAESLAIAETLEIHHALAEWRVITAATVFNRLCAGAFEAADIARMLKRGALAPELKHLDKLADIARRQLKRRNRERRALGILRRQIPAPSITLEESLGLPGQALGAELAAQLTNDSEASEHTGVGDV